MPVLPLLLLVGAPALSTIAVRIEAEDGETLGEAPVLGDVHRLDDDSTFVAFSVAGELDRVTPQGEVLFQATTTMGTAFGYVTLAGEIAGVPARR